MEVEDPTFGAHVIDVYTLLIPGNHGVWTLRYSSTEFGMNKPHDGRSDVEATVAVPAAQLQEYSTCLGLSKGFTIG